MSPCELETMRRHERTTPRIRRFSGWRRRSRLHSTTWRSRTGARARKGCPESRKPATGTTAFRRSGSRAKLWTDTRHGKGDQPGLIAASLSSATGQTFSGQTPRPQSSQPPLPSSFITCLTSVNNGHFYHFGRRHSRNIDPFAYRSAQETLMQHSRGATLAGSCRFCGDTER